MKLPLSYHAERVWSNAARRKDVNHEARQKGTAVYWIVRKAEWIALRWCYIIEYSPGVIRSTNRIEPHPPKSLWPVRTESCLRHRLEITLSVEEMDEKKYARLAEIFTYRERALDWELLDWMDSDTNLWSQAALDAQRRVREDFQLTRISRKRGS
jgi:hypothetical protein